MKKQNTIRLRIPTIDLSVSKKLKGGYMFDDSPLDGGVLDEVVCVGDRDNPNDPSLYYDLDQFQDYDDLSGEDYPDIPDQNSDDYGNIWNKLSPAEKEFILKHPIAAADFYKNANQASKESIERFPGLDGRDDARDAFRHAYWSALDAYDHGSELAREYGLAHEDEDDPKQSEAGKEMDFHNNEVGYGIGEEARENGYDEDWILQEVLNALNDGRLTTLE